MSDPICNEHAPTPHNQAICHATGEQRKTIVHKLKKILDEFDSRPCIIKDVQQSDRNFLDRNCVQKSPERQRAEKCCLNNVNHDNDASHRRKALDKGCPIIIQPIFMAEYSQNGDTCEHANKGIKKLAEQCQMKSPAQEKPQCSSKKQDFQEEENWNYKNCICLRQNGLQDTCPLFECKGKEECMAFNPGPCCRPALTQLCEMKQEKLQRQAAAKRKHQEAELNFQSMNQENCNPNMCYDENPKTLECFCYYN